MDQFFIDLFDKYATKFQRQGFSLALSKVCVSAAILVCFFLYASITAVREGAFSSWFAVLIFTLSLFVRYNSFLREKDYFENHRLTQQLNAKVLQERETNARSIFFAIFLLCWVSDLIKFIYEGGSLQMGISDIGIIFVMSQAYLDTSFYIGPGEFGKSRKESLSNDMAYDRNGAR